MNTVRQKYPTLSDIDHLYKCNRCRHVHMKGEQLLKPDHKDGYTTHLVCPKCQCTVMVEPSEKDKINFETKNRQTIHSNV